jgi:signal recognition particle receptor subunit beta
MLNFGNFNFVFDYDEDSDYIFVLIIDINDFEDDARDQLISIKQEFLRRYGSILENFVGGRSTFKDFDKFIEENIYLPPQIIITGQTGVGKTAIFDLLPGERIVNIDDNFNETFVKTVPVDLGTIKEIVVREIALDELVKHMRNYINLLKSAAVIFIVCNSAAKNMELTKELLLELLGKKYQADYYIIANFQDYKDIAFEPKKIAEFFNIRTFGFSAVKRNAKAEIIKVLTESVRNSILEKDKVIKID